MTSVPFALLGPNGKIARAEYTAVDRLRLTFFYPIGSTIGVPITGITYVCPGGTTAVNLLIADAGDDWVEVDTNNVLYSRLYVTGPVTGITSASGNFVLGYGVHTAFESDVLVTSADWLQMPNRLRVFFDDDVLIAIPPHTFEGRPIGGDWVPMPLSSGKGADWVQYLWTIGEPFPNEFRILTYPCRTLFDNGFLVIPQSGTITPTPGGLIRDVVFESPNQVTWAFENEDLISAVGQPPQFEIFTETLGWFSPFSLLVWDAVEATFTYSVDSQIPTLWRLNGQPTGFAFTSGNLGIPQSGTIEDIT